MPRTLLLPFASLERLVLALCLMIDASPSCGGETMSELTHRVALLGANPRH